MIEIYKICVYIICIVYVVLNFKYDLQMLQQNSYRPERYSKWLFKGDYASAWRLVDVALLLLLFSTLLLPVGSSIFIALVALAKIFMILRRKSKKPLVFTKRVARLYSVAAILSIAAVVVTIIFGSFRATLGVLLLLAIFSWVVVMTALYILMPVENSINRKYYNDARRIIKSMPELKVIGVTGSFGKTSTKHYLNAILSEKYDVLMTPGSYNTTMGVIRTIREMLKPYHQIFICEMGAKNIGDVKEICELVDPEIGVVTAVGEMHLESFKTIENVQKAKFELVDSLPADGLAVVNNDFEYCANRRVDNVPIVRYAVSNPAGAQYVAEDIVYSPQGTSFTVKGNDGFTLALTTQLVGECNISNLLAAVILAHYLGVSDERIRYAVSKIQQVEHRLNLKMTPGGVTIIDDAFNSNPSGSKMAVDVLSRFTSGKRIIVTPGMIELGERGPELNKKLGEHIGNGVDIAIVVGKYNREAIVEGVRSTDFNEDNIIIVDSFNEAQQRLAGLLQKGDTVLYENDLPDTFK